MTAAESAKKRVLIGADPTKPTYLFLADSITPEGADVATSALRAVFPFANVYVVGVVGAVRFPPEQEPAVEE